LIHVDRGRLTDTGQAIAPTAAWQARAAAATQLALQEADQHVANDAVYGANPVRAALEKLFFDKCAYCETQVSAGSDWDVEHFRPKGRVAERPTHPGYYWLAYTWTNLYPSCTHCNQRRIDRPRFDDQAPGGGSGKVDHFPVADEAKRAMSPTHDLSAEKPLLLDPCSDDPETVLAIGVRGLFVAIGGNRRAKTTIDIFGLNRRRRLADARRVWISMLLSAVETAADRDQLLQVFAAPMHPYAAIARAMLRDPAAFGL